MIVKDKSALDKIKRIGVCCWCGRKGPVDPHHVWVKRGLGGGTRIDIAANLCPLDRRCHNDAEMGVIHPESLLALVALRENVSTEDIKAAIQTILALPKISDPCFEIHWRNAASELSPGAIELVNQVLENQ